VATSNYVGNAGNSIGEYRWNQRCYQKTTPSLAAEYLAKFTGTVIPATGVPIHYITDGTSKTLLVGERDSYDGRHGNHGAAIWVGIVHRRITHIPGFNEHVMSYFNEDSPTMVINAVASDLPPGQEKQFNWNDGQARDSWSSQHPGGASFVFADASVHFINETIDNSTLADLCNRADGDVLNWNP
jgi:hypothetical protein